MGYEPTYTEDEFLPKIKNLDLSTPEGRKEYDKKRYDYISVAEGVEPKAYPDTKGFISVGIGFNMDRKEARAEWNLAFQSLPAASRPDFDQVYNKSRLLTLTEIRILYNYSVTSREQELRDIYGKSGFNYFTPGERLTIEEEFYNGPKITGQKTNFAKHAKAYIKAKMEGKMQLAMLHMDACLWELKYNSNKHNDPVVQKRRDCSAILYNTYNREILEDRTATMIENEIAELEKKLILALDPNIDSFIGAIYGPITGILNYDIFCIDTTNELISLLNRHYTHGVPSITWEIHQVIIRKMISQSLHLKYREQCDQYKKEIDKIIQRAWVSIIEPLRWPKKKV